MATIVEHIPIPDEPATDRAYRLDTGRVYRVRARAEAMPAMVRLGNETDAPAARGFAIEISAALLDDTLAVARADDGAVLVMQSEIHTFDLDALQRPDFDPDNLLSDRILALLDKADAWAGNLALTEDFLGRWTTGQPAGPDLAISGLDIESGGVQ